MDDIFDLDTYKQLYLLEGILVNETPLRVGKGKKEGELVDNPVIRTLNNKPYIPGSSLKGVLRTLAQRIASSRNIPVNDPFTIKPDEENQPDYDPVELLFGSPRIAGRVYVYDALPLGDAPTVVRPGVAIDRILGSQFPRRLFHTEYVEAGAKWSFKLKILNLDLENPGSSSLKAQAAGLLLDIIKYMKEVGIEVGGRRSTGAGLIKLTEYTLSRVNFKTISLERVVLNI